MNRDLYFAGPVDQDLFGQGAAIIMTLIFLSVTIFSIFILIKASKLIKSEWGKNSAETMGGHFSKARLGTFVAGGFLDAILTSLIVLAYVYLTNKVNYWSNDVWHATVINTAFMFGFIRIVPRIIFKKTLGEKLIHAHLSIPSTLIFCFVDLLLVVTAYLFVDSL